MYAAVDKFSNLSENTYMDDALKKIELETTKPTLMEKKNSPYPRKAVGISLAIISAILILFGILLFPFREVIPAARKVMASARTMNNAIKTQDIAKTKEGLAATRKALDELKNKYSRVHVLTYIPLLGRYVSDGEHAISAAFNGLDAGDRAIEALEPNADLLGLKGKSTFVSGTADDRIQTAVKTMSALTPKITEMAGSIDKLRNELDKIDPNRYPEHIGNTVVRSKLLSYKETIDNAANLFVNAQPLLMSLPGMLGEPADKRYLVLFQNDKELRPTGGFMTAYAQFRFVRGKAILEKSDDIYALDGGLQKKYPAPPEILNYLKGVYSLNIRDSNLSPDFKVSMQQFEGMYANVAGHEKIDGIFAVDTKVLVDTLGILGPLYVDGREFSAVVDKRCDCPKAVYELEDYSSRPVGYVRSQRKGEIGELLHLILQQALGVSPSKYWGKLFQMLITEINEKHMLAYMHDPGAQKGVESFNMGGRIMAAGDTAAVFKFQEGKDWDYLHINEANMGGAKSNMFISQKITKDTTINSDGTLKTKLTIDYKNPYPGSDCGLESGGLCLNAPLRDFIRVYVPKGSKLIESRGVQSPQNGSATSVTTSESLGKTVFEGFLTVNPLGTARLELSYTTPVKPVGGTYNLLLQKQPGTDGIEVLLRLNGKDRRKFALQTDTEVTLSL